jgi:hypothetical protein
LIVQFVDYEGYWRKWIFRTLDKIHKAHIIFFVLLLLLSFFHWSAQKNAKRMVARTLEPTIMMTVINTSTIFNSVSISYVGSSQRQLADLDRRQQNRISDTLTNALQVFDFSTRIKIINAQSARADK